MNDLLLIICIKVVLLWDDLIKLLIKKYNKDGTDTHVSTDWEVRKNSDNSLVWSSLNDSTNKLSITLPAAKLQVNTAYTIKARRMDVD